MKKLFPLLLILGAVVFMSSCKDEMGGGSASSVNVQLWPVYSQEANAYGYIDKNGHFVIEPKYSVAWDFNDGFAQVETLDHKMVFLDPSGKERAVPDETLEYGDFYNGFMCVRKGEKYGLMDKNFNWVLLPEFDYVDVSKDGDIIQVEKYTDNMHTDILYGFYNTRGEEVIPLQYRDASNFSDGYAAVQKFDDNDDNYYIINKKGKIVAGPFDNYVYPVGNDMFVQMKYIESEDKDLFALMTMQGDLLTDYQYEYLFNTQEGTLGFRDGDYYGYMDLTGKIIIPAKYDDWWWFREGKTLVQEGSYARIIDKSGNVLHSFPKGEIAYAFYNGNMVMTYTEEELTEEGAPARRSHAAPRSMAARKAQAINHKHHAALDADPEEEGGDEYYEDESNPTRVTYRFYHKTNWDKLVYTYELTYY